VFVILSETGKKLTHLSVPTSVEEELEWSDSAAAAQPPSWTPFSGKKVLQRLAIRWSSHLEWMSSCT